AALRRQRDDAEACLAALEARIATAFDRLDGAEVGADLEGAIGVLGDCCDDAEAHVTTSEDPVRWSADDLAEVGNRDEDGAPPGEPGDGDRDDLVPPDRPEEDGWAPEDQGHQGHQDPVFVAALGAASGSEDLRDTEPAMHGGLLTAVGWDPAAWTDAAAPGRASTTTAAPDTRGVAARILVPVNAMRNSVEALSARGSHGSLRLQLCKGDAATDARRSLRISTRDDAGWIEYHEIAVTTDSASTISLVVDARELEEA